MPPAVADGGLRAGHIHIHINNLTTCCLDKFEFMMAFNGSSALLNIIIVTDGGLRGFQGYGFSSFYESFCDYSIHLSWLNTICVVVSSNRGPLTVSF